MKAVCIECGKETALSPMRYACGCGGPLDVKQPFAGLDPERLKRVFRERRAHRTGIYASGVWRYKELIAPELPESAVVTKNEGNTGLYEREPATAYAGVRRLMFKAQSENPSGSFKDNGMTAAVSHGISLGYERFACASTGNTSASLAMYAAFAGKQSIVLVPKRDVSDNKVLQTLAAGADIRTFDGTYDDGLRYLETHAEEQELYLCNSVNPLRIEGQKSIVFELAEQLNWRLPDWIVVPGGALGNAAALGKGLRELHALGFIDKLPQLAVVQAEGAAPFHRLMNGRDGSGATAGGERMLHPEPRPHTRATALKIGHPPSWRKAAAMLELTGGTTAAVGDDEILDAKACIDRCGIGCEPASAAALAGLRQLVRSGAVHPEQTAACILTGHLLKDTDAIREYHLEGRIGSSQLRSRLTHLGKL
ncbi:threonine synthase [Paenibacillus humicola]|uniref:threonine synthase n=1 Tax=Paenibacillus humicola TaxID=3110540 RepID=UPI00237B5D69|nr:threonine synthase [Paenibacillus humicola]